MAAPLVALKDIRLADGSRPLFQGVDLALEPRVRACLVGRNGAGKSTLLRILAGQIEADAGERAAQPALRIAYVSQEPDILPRNAGEGDHAQRGGGGASTPTLLDCATADGAEGYQAEAYLTTFGLNPDKPAHGLSGGEIRRVALARALASDPDVLLLDEPTNHLDILAIQTLEDELARLRCAALIVSHDRAFLERVTQRCFWLEGRKVRRLDKGFAAFDDWAESLLAAEAEESRRLQKALEQDEYWLQRGVTARRARNEGRRRRLMSLRAEVAARRADQPRALALAVDAGQTSGKLVIEAKEISKGYPSLSPPSQSDGGVPRRGEGAARDASGSPLFSRLSLRVMRGDRLAIVGPNGAGKTTLIKTLLGEIEPDTGAVRQGAGLQPAYVDQARARLTDEETLWKVLSRDGDQILVRGQPRHVAAYAKDWLFTEAQLRQPVRTLSGGERNRLLLAKALANPTNLMVLDEPTNDLDMDTLDRLEDLLADYDGTLILVSHDRDFIDRLATSTLALDGAGRAVETPGGWTDFLRQNPGFLAPSRLSGGTGREAARVGASGPNPPTLAPAARPPVPPDKREGARKLSFKDAHRLKELDALIARLPAEITALEGRLADPALYARDPKAFAKLTADLDAARTALAAAEDEWIELEEKREALAG